MPLAFYVGQLRIDKGSLTNHAEDRDRAIEVAAHATDTTVAINCFGSSIPATRSLNRRPASAQTRPMRRSPAPAPEGHFEPTEL